MAVTEQSTDADATIIPARSFPDRAEVASATLAATAFSRMTFVEGADLPRELLKLYRFFGRAIARERQQEKLRGEPSE